MDGRTHMNVRCEAPGTHNEDPCLCLANIHSLDRYISHRGLALRYDICERSNAHAYENWITVSWRLYRRSRETRYRSRGEVITSWLMNRKGY
jgi:hypothetical protein